MADFVMAQRHFVLSGLKDSAGGVEVTPCEPAARISLRAGAGEVEALSAALGLPLPTRPKTSAVAGGRMAFWLGPDEWLVLGGDGDDLLAAAATSGVAHSAVDVSQRNTGVIVSGGAAADVINAGCPLDLSLEAFPAGAVTRTLFGKIEIVLYRMDHQTFRIECWRSFAEYALGLLSEAALDAA